ncbi:tyrosine-protein phosphatase non-receptor type 22 isoform X3 [Pleurodeles waltl]|uniref:tyrosine-protein phosphatase non-receptor type 22 isoform X3 n=1 Tax=Pleurodeles waltl TaxID=8319 RepID=UPI003709861D
MSAAANMEQKEILQRYLERVQVRGQRQRTEQQVNDFLEFIRLKARILAKQSPSVVDKMTTFNCKLKRQSAKHKTERIFTTKVAERPENIKKNRYKDILPFDHTRVELSLITSDNDSDFINGNFIKGVYEPRAYIATQGPLPGTVLDFWRMIWEYKILVIVMACMEFEMGKKKCERYWADLGKQPVQFGPFTIVCVAENSKQDYVIRTLNAKFNNESRIVYQFHYMNWPDHDVPTTVDPILDMISEMRLHQEDDNIPICIHCSAGCGRTGVICAIDYTWKLLKDKIIPENFSVYNLILEMRTQRPSLVQTKEQYDLVHNAVIQLFQSHLDKIASTSGPEGDERDITHTRVPLSPSSATDIEVSMTPLSLPQNSNIYENVKASVEESILLSPDSGVAMVKTNHLLDFDLAKKPILCEKSELNSAQECSTTWQRNYTNPFTNRHLQRHQSMELDNIGYVEWHPQPLNASGRSRDMKAPLVRAKSTPFESSSYKSEAALHHDLEEYSLSSQVANIAPSNVLNIKNQPCLTSTQWNSSNQPSVSLFCYQNVDPSPQYVRLTEDPYFSPTSSSDPESPRFAHFCVEATFSETVTKLPIQKTLDPIPCIASPIRPTEEPEMAAADPLPHYVYGVQLDKMESSSKTAVPDSDDESPPPLPVRTPESFIVEHDIAQSPKTAPPISPGPASVRLKFGTSMEWSGVSQRNTFADSSKFKSRSKSVKVRSFKMEKTFDEPFRQAAFSHETSTSVLGKQRESSPSPPPLPERTQESFLLAEEIPERPRLESVAEELPERTPESFMIPEPENHLQIHPEESNNAAAPPPGHGPPETNATTQAKDPVKRFTRCKSLKVLRCMKKGMCNAPSQVKPNDSSQSNQSRSFLNFGFGSRCSKPKGPRNPPPSWEV